ncbi:MAG: hypothetical protein K9W43_14375 [Candidatus Thorarchaeota archaeon]|nr:hypothetical protein [Candidatus Thorarchaeota archaeon]
MAFENPFTPWFFPIFVISFFGTAFIDEIQKRQTPHRGVDKTDIMTYFVALSLSFLIIYGSAMIYLMINPNFIPISTPFEFLTTPIIYILDFLTVMVAGVVSYLFLAEMTERMGIASSISFVTPIVIFLAAIDAGGWSQGAIQWLIEWSQIFSILFKSVLALLVMYVVGDSINSRLKKTPDRYQRRKMKTKGVPATNLMLQVIVFLGRRIVLDLDSDALQTLKELARHSGIYRLMKQTEFILDVDIDAIINIENITTAKDLLEPVTQPFGILTRRAYRRIWILRLSGAALVILAFITYYYDISTAVYLLTNGIFLFILVMTGKMLLSKFGPNRYGRPSMDQTYSFLLTKQEFADCVKLNRAILVGNIALLVTISFLAISRVVSVFWIPVTWGIISIIISVAMNDRIIRAVRLPAREMVSRTIRLLDYKKEPDLSADKTHETLTSTTQVETRSIPKPERGHDWREQLEAKGYSAFAQRIAQDDSNVYKEEPPVYSLLGLGIVLLIIGLIWYVPWLSVSLGPLFVVEWILTHPLLLVSMIVFWRARTNYTRAASEFQFHGISRRGLESLFLHLDLRTKEDGNIGYVRDTSAPEELQTISRVQEVVVQRLRSAVLKIGPIIPWPASILQDLTKEEKWKSEYSIKELIILSIAFLIVTIIGISLQPSDHTLSEEDLKFYANTILGWLCIIIIVIVQFSQRRTFYREKRILRRILKESQESTTIQDTIGSLIKQLKSELKYPLRLFLASTYPDVEYIGRSYLTTTGIELQEVLIIPLGMTSIDT